MRRWALVLLLAGACGPSDGGGDMDAGPRVPRLPPAESPCDAGGWEPSCGRIGCYARCGPGCSECAPGMRCVDPGICVPRGEADAACFESLGPDDNKYDQYCERGGPCLGHREDGGSFEGHCVDEATCALAQDADPELECRWYGWSVFEEGSPEGTCPEQDPRDPFCGGVCPEVDCQRIYQGNLILLPGDCVGVSERRAYGLCRLVSALCMRPRGPDDPLRFSPEELEREAEDDRRRFGDRVVCMRLAELVESGHEDEAVFVLESACRAYRAAYPDSVECMDRNWDPLD